MITARRRWLTVSAVVLLLLVFAPGTPASAVPLATVTGHVLDNGVPVAGVSVRLTPTITLPPIPVATTDDTGAFTFTNLSITQYFVTYTLPGGTAFYPNGKVNVADATPITTTVGGTLTLEESVPPHGAVQGHITKADGTPAAAVSVLVTLLTGGGGNTTTDASGYYSLPYVWVGPNRVRISPPKGSSGPSQFAYGTTDINAAHVFDIVAGQTTTVDDALLPIGTLTGQVTSQGAPAPSITVTLMRPTGEALQSTVTATDGTYRMVAVAGTYVLQFRTSTGLTEYASRKTDLASADPVVVTADQTVVVDEQLITPGTVRGTLLKADGTPSGLTQVLVSDGTSHNYFTTTNPSGAWQLSVLPGTYTVRFSIASGGSQWATGKSTVASADRIVVGEGQTVVVDDQLAAPGTVSVTAKDKRTGDAITSFCVTLFNNVCTTTGTVTLSLLPGTVNAFVNATDPVYLGTQFQAEVLSGQTTDVVVEFVKSGTITTVIRDAATGEPVGNACLGTSEPLRPSFFRGGGQCSAPDGTVTISHLRPGVYNLFVEIHDGVHGMQWVGVNHGVGAQIRARLVLVTEGETTTVPDIQLDGVGSVSGVVTDKATGQPLPNTLVGLASVNAGLGDTGPATTTDAQGRYTLGDLGPYDWTLFFLKLGYASVFSGGTGDRLLAKGATVTTGQVSTFDQTMRRGTTLTGVVTNPDGTALTNFVRVTVVHALTADELGASDVNGSTPYTIQVAAPLLVKLMVDDKWVGGDDFLHARTYLILPTATQTINITRG